MDNQMNDEFDKTAQEPTESEVFAKEPQKDLTARDVFAGDEKLYKQLEKGAPATIIRRAASRLSTTHIMLILNTIIISIILLYLMLRPPAIGIAVQPTEQKSSESLQTTPPKSDKPAVVSTEPPAIDKKTAAALKTASSWQLAEQLYNARKYNEAYHVFNELTEKLATNTPADEFMRDFFRLKMAICLQNTQGHENISALFTSALQSRSPLVRALANYRLIFAENHNKQYASARSRSYRTLALLKAFDDYMSPSFEADCYFMLAEALTRQILLLNNVPDTLPGQFWSDTLAIESIPQMSAEQLRTFVQAGTSEISEAAIGPKIQKREHLGVGAQWSVVCMEAPLEEVLSRFASASKLNVTWPSTSTDIRTEPTTLYLPAASEQLVTEVAAGTAGLIAHFDGHEITIQSMDVYTNLDKQKQLLTREAVSVWRRFLLRYRGDQRTPNAHYAIALLHDFAGETPTALGEYRLVASGYTHNPLAPFALLNASKIKTNLRDYAGAREDLNQILIQYPACKLVDQASLYLAEATMAGGLYEDAAKMFRKVYNLELSAESRCHAAYGLGRCFYETRQYEEAVKWLKHAIETTNSPTDHRLQPAYFMLGKANVALKDYKTASMAFRSALENSPHKKEYIEVTLELVRSEFSQQNFVVALNILESIPVSQLDQEFACEVLITKARILSALDINDTAVSLLRRKIEFVADSRLRAKLNFELAKCLAAIGDLRIARRKLTDALMDLPPSLSAQQANLLLAKVSMELGQNAQARDVCLVLLRNEDIDNEIKRDTLNLLGRIYTQLNQHNQAALAYAGLFDKTGGAKQ
jgi:TolA-binding protein